jgi:hypothetical protein
MNLLWEQDRWETKIFLIYTYHEKNIEWNWQDIPILMKFSQQKTLVYNYQQSSIDFIAPFVIAYPPK